MAVLAAVFLISGIIPLPLNAQTCSCAGAPIFNPLDYSGSLSQYRWHFQLTYKYHSISDLVEGKTTIKDDTDRSRTAQSLFFETRFAFTPRISVMALLNITGHSRQVGISGSDADTTSGLGDSMLSLQYSPVIFADEKGFELSIGAGIKAPTGKDNVTLTGIAAEDMQPGTGSWDTIVWSQSSIKINPIKGLHLFGGLSYRINGENDRQYRFGNEIIAALGFKLNKRGFLDYSIYTRYRWADNDQRFSGDVPNTGGKWLYIVPAITIKPAKNMGIKTELEIPIYRNLNGFRQFTSTFLLSLSLYYEV
jgi:hypothetical protein